MSSVHTAHATWSLTVQLVGQNQPGNWSQLLVTFSAQADSGWSGNASGIGFSADYYGNGGYSFNGTSFTVVQYYVTIAHDANGYGSFSINVYSNATGTSTYGGPVGLNESGSLPRIPKSPRSAPSVSAAAPVGRNVTITIGIPGGFDDGGSAINYVWSEWSRNGGAWSGGGSTGWGNRTFTNLAPGNYQFRALAHNAYGDGPLAYSNTVTVRSGGKVWNGSAWTNATAKIWNGTAWVDATLVVWNGTAWVPAL